MRSRVQRDGLASEGWTGGSLASTRRGRPVASGSCEQEADRVADDIAGASPTSDATGSRLETPTQGLAAAPLPPATRAFFEAAFPTLEVVWMETSSGADQVLLVTKEALQ